MEYVRFSDEITDDPDPDIFQPVGIDSVLELAEISISSGNISSNPPNMPNHDGFKVHEHDLEAEGNGETKKDDLNEYVDDPGKAPPPMTKLARIQGKVEAVVEHLYFRVFTILLIIVDLILVIVHIASIEDCGSIDATQIISLVIIHFFVLEVAARIFYRQQRFLRSKIDVIDAVVVFASFVIDVTLVAIDSTDDCRRHYARLFVLGRVVRIIRVVRLVYLAFTQKRQIAQATRRVISQNKQRYHKENFDLDLCYVTERVIAMSFPSTGFTSMYRNPIKEVARFLDTKHGDHYKVYNLCSEKDYDESNFHNRVDRVFIDDHNVPKLSEMLQFTDDVREWMSQDKSNIIAIHCKGGKGRTGTMVCTWLIDSGLFDQASESLNYFGERRTDLSRGETFQGVETPSQSRYVGYYEQLLKQHNRVLPPTRKLTMTFIKLQGLDGVGTGDGTDFTMEVINDGVVLYEACFTNNTNCQVMRYNDMHTITAKLCDSPVLAGDIKVRFLSSSKTVPKGYDNCAFFFWFHTSFIVDNKLTLSRQELDNPHKDKTWKVFGPSFGIEATFEDCE